MIKRLFVLLCVVVLGLVLADPARGQQQDIPPEVRQELERRGMTVEEARQRARELGIDPNNPDQAARRLRQLGVPEARIEALMQVMRPSGAGDGLGATGTIGQQDLSFDRILQNQVVLTRDPTIQPDTLISLDELPLDLTVRTSLRSRSIIQRVEPFFVTPTNDTLDVENIRRIRGSVVDGEWAGRTRLNPETEQGVYVLFVRATIPDPDTTVTLPTNKSVVVLSPEELPSRDSLRMAQDSLQYFGYDVFRNVPDAFQPSPMNPVDDNYVVGTDDELRLTVWGAAEFRYNLTVDKEGRIFVPDVGQYTVAGKRINTLRQELKQWLSQSYAGLTSDPPSVFMDLTVSRVNPIQVYVLGEVEQPGGYVISNSATVFNALYSVGGPLQRGTLRNIQVIRNGEVIETVDMYDYLLRGYQPNPVSLQDGDYVFIPPRGETVSITGPVKRPAYFEMREEETFRDLLEYAGGLEPDAYAKRFQINRITPFDEREDPAVARTVLDYNLNAARNGDVTVSLSDGDRVRVLQLMGEERRAAEARVDVAAVSGAVYKPGRYAINEGVRTVRDLIREADGLTGDAFRGRAELIRLDDDLKESVRSLNVDDVMSDEPTANVVLRPGDSLHVASVREMEEARTVEITGQVREPGEYAYRESMTIRDLLFAAGGLTDSEFLKDVFLDRADLYREAPDGSNERVIPFHLGDALNGDGMAERPLRPSDEVRIYPARVQRLEDRFVRISGAVKDTGRYAWRENLTLKDVILQANGFEEGASLQKVEVTRMIPRADGDGLRAERIQVPLTDTPSLDDVDFSVRDTARALRAAESFGLQHRDRVFVRMDPAFKPQQTVTIRGEIRFPGEYTLLRDNERLSDVIERSGGILPTGYPKGGRLTRDDEQVIVQMNEALRGDEDDDVILQPDDEIFIPTQPNTVAIRGNVANEGLVKHEPGKRVEYYLDRAGGVREDTEAIFLTQASGATFRIKTGWFRRTPKVDDGATIQVRAEPDEEEGESFDVRGTISESLAILSSALTVIVLATRAFE